MKRIGSVSLILLLLLCVVSTLSSCYEREEFPGHHIEIYGLTLGQYKYLADYKNPDYGITDEIRQSYVIVETTETFDEAEQRDYYSVKIRFGKLNRKTQEPADKEVVAKYYELFMENYYSKLDSLEPQGSTIYIEYTPYFVEMIEGTDIDSLSDLVHHIFG